MPRQRTRRRPPGRSPPSEGRYAHPAYGVVALEARDGALAGRFNDIGFVLHHHDGETWRVPETFWPLREGLEMTFRADKAGPGPDPGDADRRRPDLPFQSGRDDLRADALKTRPRSVRAKGRIGVIAGGESGTGPLLLDVTCREASRRCPEAGWYLESGRRCYLVASFR